jgi:hypothetical protein
MRRTDEALPESEKRTRCANCGIEIEDDAVERSGRTYCCEGCAIGGPCVC